MKKMMVNMKSVHNPFGSIIELLEKYNAASKEEKRTQKIIFNFLKN